MTILVTFCIESLFLSKMFYYVLLSVKNIFKIKIFTPSAQLRTMIRQDMRYLHKSLMMPQSLVWIKNCKKYKVENEYNSRFESGLKHSTSTQASNRRAFIEKI